MKRCPRRGLRRSGTLPRGAQAGLRLVAVSPGYIGSYVYVAQNAAALGRIAEARAAVAEARRIQPGLSLELIQQMYGVSRPAIDARRNAALRKAGLE